MKRSKQSVVSSSSDDDSDDSDNEAPQPSKKKQKLITTPDIGASYPAASPRKTATRGDRKGRKAQQPLKTPKKWTKKQLQAEIKKVLDKHVATQATKGVGFIHPRNSRKTFGAIYNAHRLRILTAKQLLHLFKKVTKESKVQNDGCIIPTLEAAERRRRNLRPVSVNITHRYGFCSAPKDKPKYETQFAQTAIVLAHHSKFPTHSEQECSHLCHNPLCINHEHIVWEFHKENMDRERCRYTRRLTCPGCQEGEWNECNRQATHTPNCVTCTCDIG